VKRMPLAELDEVGKRCSQAFSIGQNRVGADSAPARRL
jgi:hypothetical protein